jgi:hypothetical protein
VDARVYRLRGHRHLPRGSPHPDRTVPRATYIAVAFLGLFYAFISWVIIQAFDNTGAVAIASKNSAGMFFTAMTTYVGTWATDLMRVLIVTSLFAALLAFHNAITRYTHALASEGALPPQARPHPPRPQEPQHRGLRPDRPGRRRRRRLRHRPRRPLPPVAAVGEHPRRHRHRGLAGTGGIRGMALLPPQPAHRIRRPHPGGTAGRGHPSLAPADAGSRVTRSRSD